MNPDAPTLAREGYFTLPPLKRLQRMTGEELAAVDRFVVRGVTAYPHSKACNAERAKLQCHATTSLKQ